LIYLKKRIYILFIADVNKEMFNVYLRYLNKSKQQSKNSVFGLEF